VDTDAWFAALVDALRDAAPEGAASADARVAPAEVGALALTDAERDGLLDLARVAAHTAERWTAPVSTFLAGVAYASVPAAERAAAVRAVVEALESHGTAS
jgi:hypothetical protein